MRLLSNLVLAACVAALGFSVGALGLAWIAPPAPPFEPPVRATAAAPAPQQAARLSPDWPALFGVEIVPEPEPEPAPEPEPDPEPEPVTEETPEENTLYYLTGLVIDGTQSWAMVASNDRTQVVRIGDELEGGETVRAIDDRGVWVEWGEVRQVIPVQRTDLSGMIRIERVETPAAEYGDVAILAQLRWPVEQLDARFIEEALVEAGSLAGSTQADGSNGLDVVSIRSGQLYDQIGLRPGDTILRINGKSVDSQGLPADTPADVVNSGSLDLEILRDGTRQVIKVNVVQI